MTIKTIAIVGSGIGGLTAAIALRQRGFEVQIYEQAPVLKEAGAGLNVTPNGARVLNSLGLRDALEVVAAAGKEMIFCDYETREVFSRRRDGGEVEARYGMPHYQVHRGDLLNTLLGAVPSVFVHLNKRYVGLEETRSGVTLHFADGARAEADIVIGADGIRSRLREHVVGVVPPKFLKAMCFRALVPVSALPEGYFEPNVSFWVGPMGHMVTYLVSGGRNINIVAGAPMEAWSDDSWSVPSSVAEFLNAFPRLNGYVRQIVEAAPQIFKWGVFDLPPLDRWSKGRVVLLGDAAHAMLPMWGQGANMAMEDGVVLAAWLDGLREDPLAAFAGYEAARKPRTTRQQQFAPSESRALEDTLARMRSEGAGFKPPPPTDLSWIYGYDATARWQDRGDAGAPA